MFYRPSLCNLTHSLCTEVFTFFAMTEHSTLLTLLLVRLDTDRPCIRLPLDSCGRGRYFYGRQNILVCTSL